MISSQNKNFQEAPASRPGREAHVTVAPYVKEAELSVQRVWKAVFCLPGHVRPQHSSQANCPISGGLSRRRGTQRCLSRLDPPPVCHVQGGGQRLGRQVFASQPRGHWPFWCQMTNLDSPLSAAQHPWPYSLRKPSLPSKNTPILIYIRSFVMTLWLYMGLCLAVHVPSPLPAGPH